VTTHIELTDTGDRSPVLISMQAINFFAWSEEGVEGAVTRLKLDGWDEDFEVLETPDQIVLRLGDDPEAALFLPLTLAEGGTKVWVNASKVATFQPEDEGTTTLAFTTLMDDVEVRESLPVIRDMLTVRRRPDWMGHPVAPPPFTA
jgi:hypothetical protein